MKPILRIILLISFFGFSRAAICQDLEKSTWAHSGDIILTHNGISNIPAFSLKKPALLAFFHAGHSRFSIDPQAAFSLNGKPWFMNLWLRYKVVEQKKFELRSGMSWTLSFKEVQSKNSGDSPARINRASRYVFGELAPSWKFSDRVSLTLQYWYGHSLESDGVQQIHFTRLEGKFTRVPISRMFYVNVIPQVFYLNDDAGSGYFSAVTVRVGYRKLPLLLGVMCNQPIYARLDSKPGFIWNTHLLYTF